MNQIVDLEGIGEKYRQGNKRATYTHDMDAVSLLRDVLVELRKMNMHLNYMSGVDVENYNIEDSD